MKIVIQGRPNIYSLDAVEITSIQNVKRNPPLSCICSCTDHKFMGLGVLRFGAFPLTFQRVWTCRVTE